jgi:argininosuccinate synthase
VAPSPLVLLDVAHHALQKAAISAEAERFGALVAGEYLRLLHEGSWFSPMRAALDAYVDKMQECVGGVVRLELFDGACRVVDARVAAPSAPTIIRMAKA